eukprot:TRINITY_DN18130_c0_g1_i5.p1 TRINITY_DN18130_c0_g1~~TRINITY_DN18130_c0_g1_i5.p1  ORF type:complete len:622 (-),score=53.14 TRINITY_DN18130_c0_g1_i5:210-2075(-)
MFSKQHIQQQCAISDETEALLTKVSTSNVNNQNKNYNKTPTQEEANLAEFMSIVHQAKAGKSRQDLQEQKISIIKTQGNKIKKNEAGLMQYKYTVRPFSDEEQSKATTIIMLGESGSGKSTFMSTILNVVTGVEFDDSFRFILVPENTGKEKVLSQTKSITEYRINAHNGYPPIIFVDTPGFGDTRGIQRDQQIFNDLSVYLQNINYVHAVCMVAKSSANRLSVYQKYIFDSVFNLFGKDVVENFICLLTFCDVGQPQILEALQSDQCDIKEHIQYIQLPWYLKLNNIGMFCQNYGEEKKQILNEQYFNICEEGINRFLAKFTKLRPKTLILTKQQLGIKANLEYDIESLKKLLSEYETHFKNVKKLMTSIVHNQEKINSCKSFMIEQDDIIITKVPLPDNQSTATCLDCNRTCHENCKCPINEFKYNCIAINKEGYCKYCSCRWERHKNLQYRVYIENVRKMVKSEDLFQMYTVASDEQDRAQAFLIKAAEQQQVFGLKCLKYQESIAQALRTLNTIALKKVDSTSTSDFIQMQIKMLEQQQPQNLERIAMLKEHQQKYQDLQKFAANDGRSMQDIYNVVIPSQGYEQVVERDGWRRRVQNWLQKQTQKLICGLQDWEME